MNFGDIVFRPLDTEPAAPVELLIAWRLDNENPARDSVVALFPAS